MRETTISLIAGLLARRLSIVFPVGYMAVLLVFATIPDEDVPLDDRHFLWLFALVPSTIQNFLHIPAYGLLGFAWRWALDRLTPPAFATAVAGMLTIGFGVFQELSQSLVPGRFASMTDVIFNTIGAFAGLWLYPRLQGKNVTKCPS